MKYNQYDIEDFLADKDFISWIKEGDKEQSYFFSNWLDTNPDNKAKALIAREMLLAIKTEHLEATQQEFDEVLESLMKRKEYKVKHWDYRGNNPVIWWRWAAIIAFVFSLSFALYWVDGNKPKAEDQIAYITKGNEAGKRSQIMLPDGTKVFLNACSNIKYSDHYGHKEREIELSGEAFFDVAENKASPFIVRTGDIYTRALGTSFNVHVDGQQEGIIVSLVSGSVEVGHINTRQKVQLKAGEKVNAIDEGLNKSHYAYKDIAWKDGVIVFEKASFSEVQQTLEKWYGVTIEVINSPGEGWQYSGMFKNSSLQLIIERMSFTERFNYERKEDFITITF